MNSTAPSEEILYRYRNPVGSGRYLLDTEETGSQQIVLHTRQITIWPARRDTPPDTD